MSEAVRSLEMCLESKQGDTMSGRKRLLVVDEDLAALAYLGTELVDWYDVILAPDSREAVALALEGSPDVVLCAIDMPNMSGGEVAAALAEDAATRHIPFVYLTSHISPDRDLGGQVGSLPGLCKRAPVSELLAKLGELTAVWH